MILHSEIGLHSLSVSDCWVFWGYTYDLHPPADVYDGKEWKQHPLAGRPNTLGFSLGFDGVPFFKSTNYSVWPVFLINLNLPPAERYACESQSIVSTMHSYTRALTKDTSLQYDTSRIGSWPPNTISLWQVFCAIGFRI
jgi:hypothetical protein